MAPSLIYPVFDSRDICQSSAEVCHSRAHSDLNSLEVRSHKVPVCQLSPLNHIRMRSLMGIIYHH